MKRIAAIALAGLLLFNWIGYRLFISLLQQEAAVRLESSLDRNDYDQSQLISIKVLSAHLDSYANTGILQRTNGEVEIRGVLYKYVAKRFFNDTLEYLCLPDQTSMKLQSAKNEFFSLVNDLKQTGAEKKTDPHAGNSKYFPLDYINVTDREGFSGLKNLCGPRIGYYISLLKAIYPLRIEQPPEIIS